MVLSCYPANKHSGGSSASEFNYSLCILLQGADVEELDCKDSELFSSQGSWVVGSIVKDWRRLEAALVLLSVIKAGSIALHSCIAYFHEDLDKCLPSQQDWVKRQSTEEVP